MLKTSPIRGDFPSLKLNRMVRYNSTIERDYLYFLEYWSHVLWYCEQPLTIKHKMPDGYIRRYTPDYEVHEAERKALVECKPHARIRSDHTLQQEVIGQNWAKKNDYDFIIITDDELRTGHRLANLKLFWRYARYQNRDMQHELLEYGGRVAQFSVEQYCQQHKQTAQTVFPTICYALFHQYYQTDFSRPFSITTPLWLAQES